MLDYKGMTKLKQWLLSMATLWSIGVPICSGIFILAQNTLIIPTSPKSEVLTFSGSIKKAELLAVNAPLNPEMNKSDIIGMIREKALERGLNPEIMVKIGKCESGLRQFNEKGAILPGNEVPTDKGIFQINIDPKITNWADVSRMTGYDWQTLEGNIDLAMWIAENSGYQNWVCYKSQMPSL